MYPQAFYSAYKVFSEVGEVITFSSTPEGLRISGSSEIAEAEVILTLEGGGFSSIATVVGIWRGPRIL
jgi:hypothetical protein